MFVDSGSLKSTLTWFAADLINETRQACGGHGYPPTTGLVNLMMIGLFNVLMKVTTMSWLCLLVRPLSRLFNKF